MNKDYNDFIKTQSIKESILKNTEAWGRTQFVDEIYRLQQENQQLKEEINKYKRLGFKHLQDKNNLLEDSWNELFQWLNEQEEKAWDEASSVFGEVSNKMKELEKEV